MAENSTIAALREPCQNGVADKLMATGRSKESGIRTEKIVEFLEAAYDFETDEAIWVPRVLRAAKAVWKRGRALHGGTYDASDINAFRMLTPFVDGFTAEAVDCIMKGLDLVTPELVARNFRELVGMQAKTSPEMDPMNEQLRNFGFPDTLFVNGVDPSDRGVLVGLWSVDRGAPPDTEMAVFRRMAHHLAAAYRCRRRLREAQPERSSVDVTEGAAAVLDARQRVVHATGLAETKEAQKKLIETAHARDRARTARPEVIEGLNRWRPLTDTRWTLVDSYERSGARYIIARENQCEVHGLAALSDRERQVVAYAAFGQSTKETAYALGIADTTVRVLLSRAASKLGVKTRKALLDHPEVQLLRRSQEPLL